MTESSQYTTYNVLSRYAGRYGGFQSHTLNRAAGVTLCTRFTLGELGVPPFRPDLGKPTCKKCLNLDPRFVVPKAVP